ncbi:MAG TPA: NAD(P)-dependent oxidoreductase [Bryobacteraceae bacterium]|nr:NAD(P)-dependent oxidoreductase [Bryobacteraceae bacterium]
MQTQRILIAEREGFPPQALARLERVATVELEDLDRPALEEAVGEADVLWVRLRHRIDRALLERAPRLKVLVTPTTGLNHVDTEELATRGITLLSLRGEAEFLRDVRATAEHTVGLLLALLRQTAPAAADAQAGGWRRDRFQGTEIYGKTVGIVGYGRLGRIVSRYLKAFDARVIATDPKLPAGFGDGTVEGVTLTRLVAEADIVSLHADLRPDTRGFFTAALFRQMKWASYFVNTARGELIDEAGLLASLREGRLAGAALDVVANETSAGMGGHPLIEYARRHAHLLITPHVGGCTHESKTKTELYLAGKLADLLEAGAPTAKAS